MIHIGYAQIRANTHKYAQIRVRICVSSVIGFQIRKLTKLENLGVVNIFVNTHVFACIRRVLLRIAAYHGRGTRRGDGGVDCVEYVCIRCVLIVYSCVSMGIQNTVANTHEYARIRVLRENPPKSKRKPPPTRDARSQVSRLWRRSGPMWRDLLCR